MHPSRTIVVLGGSGFIGKAAIAAAVASGHRVLAVARSTASAEAVASLGAEALRGDTTAPERWIERCDGADAVIDLTQPAIPARLTARAIGRMAAQRVAATTAMMEALGTLPPDRRPLWVSVNGTDALVPDASGRLSGASDLRRAPRGFARIGLPVRAAVAASAVEAAYVHFGQMVYGPGKAFAGVLVEGIRAGRAVIVGSGGNHLPLTHIDDAGASLSHIVGLPAAMSRGGRSWRHPPPPPPSRSSTPPPPPLSGVRSPGTSRSPSRHWPPGGPTLRS